MESIRRSVSKTKRGESVIILGVGNTSGVGNNKKDADKTTEWVKKTERKLKAKKRAD